MTNKLNLRILSFIGACSFLLIPEARAGMIRFDETTAPANGLSVGGVLFGFYLGGTESPEAIFGAVAPLNDTILQDFVLLAPARDAEQPGRPASLTLAFAQPTSVLEFGLLVSTTLDTSLNLYLFDAQSFALAPIVLPLTYDHANCDPSTALCFAEIQYSYIGNVSLSGATLNFDGVNADSFAIDNLHTEQAPEPGTAVLQLIGALTLCGGAYFRKSRPAV